MFHDVYHERKEESGFQNSNALIYKLSAQSFEEIVRFISENNKGKKCIVTFDDGGESFINIIVPILDKYNIRGHFFIATDFIGTKGFVSEEQLIEMRRRGHIIGSHTASHCPDLSSMSNEEIRKEWESSIFRLNEILNEAITEVSIPNGNYDRRTLECLSTIDGIERVFTSFPSSDVQRFKSISVVGRYGIREGMTEEVVNRILHSRYYRFILKMRKAVLSVLKKIFGDRYEALKNICLKRF